MLVVENEIGDLLLIFRVILAIIIIAEIQILRVTRVDDRISDLINGVIDKNIEFNLDNDIAVIIIMDDVITNQYFFVIKGKIIKDIIIMFSISIFLEIKMILYLTHEIEIY